MDDIISIFKKLVDTKSANDKIEIVRANGNDEMFLENLAFLVDSNITTGLSLNKINKDMRGCIECKTLTSWCQCLSYIRDNNTGTDADIMAIRKFINCQDNNDKWFYESIMTKTLRVGMTVKSVNKAIPNLINTYDTQQGYLIDDKHMPEEGEVFSLSQKLNGINGGFLKKECLSRQGKPLSGMSHILHEIEMLGLGNKYINGELIRINHDNLSDEENFRKACAIINTDDYIDKTDIEFVFYEILSIEEFNRGKSNDTYMKRLSNYKTVQNEIKELGLKHIRFIPIYYVGSDKSEIDKWLAYADDNGLEGLMLNKDTYWINRRNYGLLKVKSFKTADLRCTGVLEGKGKNKGLLGSIVVDYKGYALGVGGFTDVQRADWWANPEEIIGKIVTVKYKTESRNKEGGIGVQFPTFEGIRFDKNEVSYN